VLSVTVSAIVYWSFTLTAAIVRYCLYLLFIITAAIL
jgi:hypothetical protein